MIVDSIGKWVNEILAWNRVQAGEIEQKNHNDHEWMRKLICDSESHNRSRNTIKIVRSLLQDIRNNPSCGQGKKVFEGYE